MPSLENPYAAGPGLDPPHLAGRRREIGTIETALDLIKDKTGKMSRSPRPAIVLSGPRGIGKTVLLGHATEQAERRGIHVAVVTAELLSESQDSIVKGIFPSSFLKTIREHVNAFSLAGFAVDLNDVETRLDAAMPVFLSKHPLLIIMDEAHTCKPEALKLLFGVVQRCMNAKLPLAVVIAGTPGLESLLMKCDATYMERSKILNFNTLSRDEAKEALELPAKDGARPIAQDALDQLLDWADNYPYFVQMAGEETWNASVNRGGGSMTVEDAKAGLEPAGETRDRFFARRYNEIVDQQLMLQATQAIEILEGDGNEVIREQMADKLMKLNDGMDDLRALEAVDCFLKVGFLWCEVDVLEPGIPSMFDFIKRMKALAA